MPYYFALWDRKCWKCGSCIRVALNVSGWSFVPEDSEGSLWDDEIPDDVLKILRSLGAVMEKRHSKEGGMAYYGNICPYCGALQGDFYLNEELLEYAYDENPKNNLLIVEIKDGKVVRTFRSIPEAYSFYSQHY